MRCAALSKCRPAWSRATRASRPISASSFGSASVVEESDGDLMGDGVNIATRLEGVAKPGFQTPSPNARVRRGGLGSRIGARLQVGDRLAERRAQRRFIVT